MHRLLALAQQGEARLPAAVEEISHVVTAEISAQSDLGTFGVPAPQPLLQKESGLRGHHRRRRS
jgi:hypothetical protein